MTQKLSPHFGSKFGERMVREAHNLVRLIDAIREEVLGISQLMQDFTSDESREPWTWAPCHSHICSISSELILLPPTWVL